MLLKQLNNFIGITTSSQSSIKIAILRKTFKSWKILSLKEISKEEIPYYSLKGFLTSSVSTSDIIVKSSTSKLKKKHDAARAFVFQIEPILPFQEGESLIQTIVKIQKNEPSLVSAFVTRRTKIEILNKELSDLSIFPEKISCKPFDLSLLMSFCTNKENHHNFVVFIGENEVSCLLLSNNFLIASRAFPSKQKDSILCDIILQTKNYFLSTFPDKNISQIMIWNASPLLLRTLQEKTSESIVLPNLNSELEHISKSQWLLFGETIATAMAGYSSPLSFEIQTLKEKKSFVQKIKKFLFPLAILSLTYSIIIGGVWGIKIFNFSKKFHSRFEKELHTKISQFSLPKKYFDSFSSIKDSLKNKIYSLPVKPKFFTIKNLLLSLVESPSFKNIPFSLEFLNYTLENYPNTTKPQKFFVKFHIKGTVENEKDLIKLKKAFSSSSFVDNQNHFKWNQSGESFDLEFFLKDYTFYQNE